jgi:tetratricopeptide (TPR) repeat protein
MSQKKLHIQLFIAFAALILGSSPVFAQSYADAVERFNEAQEVLRANNYHEALQKFKTAAQVSRSVGSEADEIRTRAENQIPAVQFVIARELLNARKFQEAIDAFAKANEYARTYNVARIQQQSANILPVIHLQYGNTEFRNGNIDKAETLYRKAIELNMNYARAYYQLGLVFRNRENLDEAISYYDQAIQIARNTGDEEVAQQAEAAARDYLTFRGASMVEGNPRAAVRLLERSLEYDMEHADTYYRLAEAYNNLAMWAEAIRAANQALRYERGGQVARAKIHFELGVAYKAQDNTAQACEAFRNAAYGQFRAAAEHEMEHELRCGNSRR